MRVQFGECLLELVQGDITTQSVDAIVNAANSALAGGGGVDGAIHRAGGASLMEQSRREYPTGCPTGNAVVTFAGNLPAKFVFHAVGPVWQGGHAGEAESLQSAYQRCLELAVENQCESIAFPAISTGIYRFPIDQAATISLTTAAEFLTKHQQPRLVRFVLFDGGAFGSFARVLEMMSE